MVNDRKYYRFCKLVRTFTSVRKKNADDFSKPFYGLLEAERNGDYCLTNMAIRTLFTNALPAGVSRACLKSYLNSAPQIVIWNIC